MGNAESSRTATQPGETATEGRSAVIVKSSNDGVWWQEIEHENLVLEQLPTEGISANVTKKTNAVVKASASASASESATSANETESASLPLASSTDPPALQADQSAAVPLPADKEQPESNNSSSSTALSTRPREQTMEEFKEELRCKRLARQTAVQDLRDEINNLRLQLAKQQAENLRLRKQPNIEEEAVTETETEAAAAPGAGQDSDPDDENPTQRSRHANIELANAQLALQLANADNISLRSELDMVQRQVGTLKEVISCCKQMLNVKEEQCTQLKAKLQEIETSFNEREMKIMSNNLRQEYERQLVNIRQLRQLYEERQRVAAAEYENLQRLISIKRDELTAEQEKTKNFEERNQTLLKEVETANNELAKLREECSEHKFEKRSLKEEMGAVNMLFSQMVMGFNNGKNNLDIDRLTKMLEENRDLLNEMTQAEGSCSEGATLPKLLFELVQQATLTESNANVNAQNNSSSNSNSNSSSRSPTPTPQLNEVTSAGEAAEAAGEDITDAAVSVAGVKSNNCSSPQNGNGSMKKHRRRSGGGGVAAAVSLKCHEPEIMGKVASAQEIIGNLPKVWKVLMELLSHHKIERVQFEELPSAEDEPGQAKAAAAGAAKATELSVSKTYIKLKDLILEKKSLVKETTRLKTLNSHLDYRLNEQEKRLSAVSLELTKTWHLVGKMQRQHRQLHTQEQILRYQLQQKRRLLCELKDELEYCRRKWAAARAKNEESQEQCDDLRREFARRKLEDANHSAESGYSDSGPQSEDESALTGGVESIAVAAASTTTRRKLLRDQFEHTRRIKRMQSTSPGRAAAWAAEGAGATNRQGEEIVLRWNSAPPTCGWTTTDDEQSEDEQVLVEDADSLPVASNEAAGAVVAQGGGALPKTTHHSRSTERKSVTAAASSAVTAAASSPLDSATSSNTGDVNVRANRILKLEEQCKSLIQQVLETSGNRERLEIQLCRFQDEIAPVQHAVPLEEFINRKRIERMTRASSAPVGCGGSLTAREEEYTRKRSERLGRLEEESRQLMSRIKRTADRGHYLKKSLDRIRRAPSREGSFESNTEEESKPEAPKDELVKEAATVEDANPSTIEFDTALATASATVPVPAAAGATDSSPLTAQEIEYTEQRRARVERVEQESQKLVEQLMRNAARGNTLSNRLDTLHEQYGREPAEPSAAALGQTVGQRLEDIERISASRAERLLRMEAEGNELIARLNSTKNRGTAMINRIAEREANRRQEAEIVEQALPTEQLNNMASSGVVGVVENVEEGAAACCVTVTTTSSQLAMQQPSTGAIPKSKPQAQLCAATRQGIASRKRDSSKENLEPVDKSVQESLEDMVQRLRALPFPAVDSATQPKDEDEMAAAAPDELKENETERENS